MHYSCNKDADTWVKQNLEEISKMTHTELFNIKNHSYQRAAFAAFSPEQKYSFWIGKLKCTMELEWTQEEREHIKKLINIISENKVFWFANRRELASSKIDDLEDNITLLTYEWQEYATDVLGWDHKQLGAIIATPSKVVDKKRILLYDDEGEESELGIVAANVISPSITLEPDCDCAQNSNWCPKRSGVRRDCKDETCVEPLENCGTLLLYRCNGVCD